LTVKDSYDALDIQTNVMDALKTAA